ncbi:hypothetical protein HS1genome_0264 [Sulfodiicoccus acidiphilus]|uniref:Uncharacterized protein n=2 Tax=Sulfodiicoccus acidiphilus TaxID=1670455 RepID=A0A348B123_9CREN|nr:hypothetical protein HS1genome_0264 [Sulfodiicoccus acidiphilus]GGT91134.1 hypothetical protein GCM10007116_06050 [Sulfodiicoccus acidiphilus]
MGSVWLSLANPRLIFFDPERMEGVISTNREGYKVVIASTSRLKHVKDQELLLIPLRTTGSLKKAKKLIGSR